MLFRLIKRIQNSILDDVPPSKKILYQLLSELRQRADAARKLVDKCDKTTLDDFERLSASLDEVKGGIDTLPEEP